MNRATLIARLGLFGLGSLWGIGISGPAADAVPELTVPLPPGETRLLDIGLYRVGWQSYGREPVWMPVSWVGHFDAQSGISYTGWGRVSGREALLMHSPWHVPAGRTWAEYRLVLPASGPIQLSFGIAMGPDVATPDKSDGVTFSGAVSAGGEERELFRRHHAGADWLDYTFDLSEHAGQRVTLRLQVEPGPNQSASWDYSFFGDARITVGEGRPDRSALVARLSQGRAGRANSRASATALSNNSRQGVVPSNLLPFENTLERAGQRWQFTYAGADARLVCTWDPATGTLDDFTVRVDNQRPFRPALGGGVTATITVDGAPKTWALRGGRPTEVRRTGDTLHVLWEYDAPPGAPPLAGGGLRVAWSYRVQGKALVISARCDQPVISRFSLGEAAAALRRTFAVPYLLGRVSFLPAEQVFAARYLDWTVSHASSCPQGTADYEPRTDGQRNLLFETGYVAVSPEVGEVLPNIPHPASPHLAELGPRIMLDVWGHHGGTYAGDAEKLRELKDNGVDHLVIIQHDWQRYGYDVKLPDHLPANPAYGGDAGLIEYGRAANECGYLWSLHENYIDLYPDAPSYDPAARVLRADGSPSPAWYNPGTKVQSFGLKSNRALEYARQNSPEAHRRYGTTAAYLDVHTCVPPWHQLDHDATQPLAGMALAKVKNDIELFQFERNVHGGPLFGEGANHFYWAGRCDGVEAQVQGGEDHTPFLDFDLLKLHPQMVNHGLGYYERWYRRGYSLTYGRDAGSVQQWDKYRAMELAYGHAGFLGHVLVHNVQAVAREHHLMHPVQRLYGASKPVEIRYEVEGQWVPASVALAAGDTTRQRIRYDSGLTLWVNWRAETWGGGSPKDERNPKDEAAKTEGNPRPEAAKTEAIPKDEAAKDEAKPKGEAAKTEGSPKGEGAELEARPTARARGPRQPPVEPTSLLAPRPLDWSLAAPAPSAPDRPPSPASPPSGFGSPSSSGARSDLAASPFGSPSGPGSPSGVAASGLGLPSDFAASGFGLPSGLALRPSDFIRLPQWGFLAIGPGTEAHTALHDGRVADYAECPEFIFADARTWFDLPYRQAPTDIEPRVASFRYVGEDRAEVAYEWVVNQTVERDYHCFVHALDPADRVSEAIVFQQDHALPKPTSQWRKGEAIVDGPHTLRVSGTLDTYDLVMGLFRGERLALKGLEASAKRILVGRLRVERQDGRVVNVRFEAPTPAMVPDQPLAADFEAHTNPVGTWIDFGKVATDGAVKINRLPDRLVVFPYPRERGFRVELNLAALLPGVRSRCEVRALAAGTQRDLGLVTSAFEDGRLRFSVGMRGAGRYVVSGQ